MASEKPEQKPDAKAAKEKSPAAERVDALTTAEKDERPEPGQASQRLQEQRRAAAGSDKPTLTEKQRIEARRKRKSSKKRRTVSGGNVLSNGLRATIREARRTFLFVGRSLLGGLDRLRPLGGIVVNGLSGLLGAIVAAAAVLGSLTAAFFEALGRGLLALDRIVTARRGLILIGLAGGGLLIASQFLDFKAIEIGQPDYAGVQEITRAPRLEAETPIDSHSLILVMVGALAVAAAGFAAVSRKRIAGLVLALSGAVALGLALLVDLPAGLDTAGAELAFSGVDGVLLSGFWLELGAGAVLLVSGIALVLDSPAPRRSRARSPRPVNDSASGSRA